MGTRFNGKREMGDRVEKKEEKQEKVIISGYNCTHLSQTLKNMGKSEEAVLQGSGLSLDLERVHDRIRQVRLWLHF